ncbi:hypothetical protein GCM10023083_87790 [Streptomyces phyllanthi]
MPLWVLAALALFNGLFTALFLREWMFGSDDVPLGVHSREFLFLGASLALITALRWWPGVRALRREVRAVVFGVLVCAVSLVFMLWVIGL